MQILGYSILLFGLIGIALGLYGLFMPSARARGISLNLPQLHLPNLRRGVEDLDEIAELEESGFRGSPFEARSEPSSQSISRRDEPASQLSVALAPLTLEEESALVLAEEDEELDPVIAELLTEQALPDEDASGNEDPLVAESPDEEEAVAAGGEDVLSSELLDLFAEVAQESVTPVALRDAIPQVTIEELLNEAREVHRLMHAGRKTPAKVA